MVVSYAVLYTLYTLQYQSGGLLHFVFPIPQVNMQMYGTEQPQEYNLKEVTILNWIFFNPLGKGTIPKYSSTVPGDLHCTVPGDLPRPAVLGRG